MRQVGAPRARAMDDLLGNTLLQAFASPRSARLILFLKGRSVVGAAAVYCDAVVEGEPTA
jgi:hypothetical protein